MLPRTSLYAAFLICAARAFAGDSARLEGAAFATQAAHNLVVAGRNTEAEDRFHQAIRLWQSIEIPPGLQSAVALCRLGNLYLQLGCTTEAEKTELESLAILRKVRGADHPDVAGSCMSSDEFTVQVYDGSCPVVPKSNPGRAHYRTSGRLL